jgi:arsenate reductase
MSDVTIYHNPRCSKSRQTLELLQQRGIEPRVVLYLEQPPTKKQLKELVSKLGIEARDLLRRGEEEYKAFNLADPNLSDSDLLAAMSDHPKLIERPIVVRGESARLGRPPENVLELFD